MSRTYIALAALGVVAGAVVPSVSHAQLGGLTKKAKAAAASAAGVPDPNTRYVKSIDLTAAQITAVNQGMAKAIQIGPETIKKWEKAQEAYEKAMEDYRKKKEKWDACMQSEEDKARAKLEAASKKGDAAAQKLQDETDTSVMVSQARAAQAAAERVANGTGTAADRQTMADFQKTMAGVQTNANAAMGAMQEQTALQKALADSAKAKCGAAPVEPTLGGGANGAAAGAAGAAPTSAADEITKAAAAAAGMTEAEYRLAREKAMGYAASHTQVQGGGSGSASTGASSTSGGTAGGAGTTDAEADAINKALAQTGILMVEANKANVPLN
jgi:hypothetical protein